ncbi:peptide transporter [bacterium]|nr:peptide transporter [bacterium]
MAEAPSQAHQEVELYRNLLATPTEFKEGFGWTTVAGIVFCGLVMMPASIYLGLMTGGNMSIAATWVTVILFSEIARRALQKLSAQQLVILLTAAGSMSAGGWAGGLLQPGGAAGQLVYRAYLVRSDAIRDAGMRHAFPSWFVPGPDSPAILQRTLFHVDWLAPIALVAVALALGFVCKYTLGYLFFRLASDIERLPFPLAPIQASGAMALAESDEPAPTTPATGAPPQDLATKKPGARKRSERWRLFSLGTTLGIAFGILQVGVPTVSGLILDKPFFLIPQPFVDTTTLTEGVLPATPSGMALDLGVVLMGMVLPFWVVIGSFLAILSTFILNPVLQHFDVLVRWQPGMDTVNTTFANSVDFWLSFGIGAGLGIAVVSVYHTVRSFRQRLRQARAQREGQPERGRVSLWATPRLGRGDYPIWCAVLGYLLAASVAIALCYHLLPKSTGILVFLVVFLFFYNPFIAFVNARLLGIAGQMIDIPFVRESAFILSGARGISIWLAPIPMENYGMFAQAFRVNELTGTRFWSLLKVDAVVLPTSFLLSLMFWGFIWSSDSIPSTSFPAAQVLWELQSKQQALLFSSTHEAPGEIASGLAQSQLMQAIHPKVIGGGFGFTVLMFTVVNVLGLPITLVYGMIRGFGALPHFMLLEVIGAFLGRFYFQKRFGTENFLRMIPIVVAGYFTGVGLIGMVGIAMKLIQTAVSGAPF